MKLFIKNMVSNSCRTAVKQELNKVGLHFIFVNLGEIEILEDISEEQRNQLKIALLAWGFELMDNKRSVLVEKIKNAIIETVHRDEEIIKTNFSDYLSGKLNYNYTYLANLFKEIQGTTIERFMISHKVERIKELIIYGELTMSQIAYKMKYSSIGHLSNQFKQMTGLSLTQFKQLKDKRRNAIEEIGNSNSKAFAFA